MSSLDTIAVLTSIWLGASLIWAAAINGLSQLPATAKRNEESSSYWLIWAGVAVMPLTAPLFVVLPLPIFSPQLDVAVLLSDWTAPLQRQGLEIGGVARPAAILVLLCFALGIGRSWLAITSAFQRAAKLRQSATPLAVFDSYPDTARILLGSEGAPTFCIGGASPAVIISPDLLQQLSASQVRMVVRHELEHIRRRDPRLFVVLACIDVLFWFNPFVRTLTAKCRLAAEITCDIAACDANESVRPDYAYAIVRAVENRSRPSLAIPAFGQGLMTIRARIWHVLHGASRKPNVVRLAAIGLLSVTLSISVTALATTTARMAVFGDPTLQFALGARAAALYGQPRCTAVHLN